MGPMVEIEREKVPRRRVPRMALRQSPRPSSPRAEICPGCIPFSLCYGEASRRCLFHPTAERISATYARLPSKYLPFPCPDESCLAVTRFHARAPARSAENSHRVFLFGEKNFRHSKSPSFPFSPSPSLSLKARASSSSSARSTYDQKKRD